MVTEGPETAPPTGTPEDIACARVRAVQAAADAVLVNGPYAVATPYGEVRIQAVTSTFAGGTAWVDVYTQGDTHGEHHYRVVNPPTLVADPAGSIQINGRWYREDPLRALAYAVAREGGASRPRGRRVR